MHQLLMVAIGYMISYTLANLGYVWPSLHWLIGLLTVFVVVRWEVKQLGKMYNEAVARVKQRLIDEQRKVPK